MSRMLQSKRPGAAWPFVISIELLLIEIDVVGVGAVGLA